MTFAILATDGYELGVGVSSGAFAVGAGVPTISRHGIVVSQGFSNRRLGALIQSHLSRLVPAELALEKALASDANPDLRQVAVLSADGSIAVFTGDCCVPYAGSWTGDSFLVVGNMLLSHLVVETAAETFLACGGPLSDRLISAMKAAQNSGGDVRGLLSAAIKVVVSDEVHTDLRVDNHRDPIGELARLHETRRAIEPIDGVLFGDSLIANLVDPEFVMTAGFQRRCKSVLRTLLEVASAKPDDPNPLLWAGLVASRIGEDGKPYFELATRLNPQLVDFEERLRAACLL